MSRHITVGQLLARLSDLPVQAHIVLVDGKGYNCSLELRAASQAIIYQINTETYGHEVRGVFDDNIGV